MPNNTPTEHEVKLTEALQKRGVDLNVHHWDGHKHVDIYIPRDSLYIEVDGTQHITKPDKIISHFNPDFFHSKMDFLQNTLQMKL